MDDTAATPTQGKTNIPTGSYIANLSENITHESNFVYDPYVRDWVDLVEILCLSILTLIGTPSNAFLLFVKVKCKHRTSTDFLVMTLAAFDFFGVTYCNIFLIMHAGLKKYVLSAVFCKLMTFGSYCAAFETAFLIGAMAFDRLILTMFSLSTFYNARVTKWMLVTISIMCLILTSPFFFFLTANTVYGHCDYIEGVRELMKWWNRLLIFLVTVSCIFIVIAYTSIVIMLKRRHTDWAKNKTNKLKAREPGDVTEDASKSESISTVPSTDVTVISERTTDDSTPPTKQLPDKRKVVTRRQRAMQRTTVILFLISMIYVVSWTSGAAVMTTNYTLPATFSQLAHVIRKITLVSNPLLYMSMSSKFRHSARRLLCRTGT